MQPNLAQTTLYTEGQTGLAVGVSLGGMADAQRFHVPLPRRLIAQHRDGAVTLYYGIQEARFDEPALHGLALALVTVASFDLAEAESWAPDAGQGQVAECLAALVAGGILATGAPVAETLTQVGRVAASPLVGGADVALNWAHDARRIGEALLGETIEPGHLEMIIPVFRLAHPALDSDGRQVGEANVFPKPLRLAQDTVWQSCTYPGTRHLDDKPMNVTALKAMRAHWPQMMAVLATLRTHYLHRAGIEGPLTLGQIERLCIAVLSLPTWVAMTQAEPLHPVLSSLFRVTDGLRIVAHQMLFVPVAEPVLPAHTVVSAAEFYDYAERSLSFHSETGVCAGPQHFIAEFLSVLVEGAAPRFGAGGQIDPPVRAALDQTDAAFDYGFAGLAVHAATFAMAPVMAKAYDRLVVLAAAMPDGLGPEVDALRDGLARHGLQLRHGTHFGQQEWRQARLAAYDEMHDSARALAGLPERSLAQSLARALTLATSDLRPALAAALARFPAAEQMASVLADFTAETQSLLRLAGDQQAELAARMGRPAARPFVARDLSLHLRLQGDTAHRLPFLPDAIAALTGLRLEIGPDAATVTNLATAAAGSEFHARAATGGLQ